MFQVSTQYGAVQGCQIKLNFKASQKGIIIYSLDVYFGEPFLIAMGLFRWLSGKESTCQCRRHRGKISKITDGKIPWSRKWQPLQYSCWKIPWTEEPGGLQSIGSQRVGQIHQSFLLCLIRLFLSHLRIIAYLKVIKKLSFFLYNIYCFTFIFVSLQ